ncbi:MAG: hypothetical protein H3C62_15405, partial [Gemmatimonadaceae bacterium]|nr:hypothetical protein [Gemmatimonadaceae bacterium]
MRKHFLWLGASLVALTACGNNLEVVNHNNPDVARAYATPSGVEGVVGGLGVQLNNTQRLSESINTQAKILSGEQFATVANFGMAARTQIPRGPISNDLGNDQQAGNRNNWDTFNRTARSAANAIQAIAAYQAKGLTMGSAAQDARARAFAFMILGNAMGYLSIGYDSAAIITSATPSDEVPALSAAKDVNKAALAMLDSAIAIANAGISGSNGFPLPSTWMSGQANLNAANFVRLVRSYKARIRAGVARTPAERAAVDWAAVIADATNGITEDFTVSIGGSTGWSAQFDVSQSYVTGGWHSLPLFYYGMADTSGAYDAWLKDGITTRSAFLVRTPDRRWPSGETRAAQQAEAPTVALPLGRYFRNRPRGEDVPVTGWGHSWYDHRRYGVVNLASLTGPYVEMSQTEIDMLAAEGYIRTGNLAAAAALIDKTRIKNGLGSIGVPASATAPYSTAASCVPHVPQAPSFTSTACGNIMEAMKYEKRMETAFTGYLVWYADSRGWGDLVQGTIVEWPVPYQEMQARYQPYHTGLNAAPKGT